MRIERYIAINEMNELLERSVAMLDLQTKCSELTTVTAESTIPTS